ncbi:tetratricopeptide repeat protein, partial [Spirillospora sp. NPDC049652]
SPPRTTSRCATCTGCSSRRTEVRQLDRTQRRFFRLLGLLPGSSFDEYVAAAVADVSLRDARTMLEDLLDAHLVQQPAAGRYRLHDLVREHARRAAAEQDSQEERDRAVRRVLDYYVHAAAAAEAAMPYLSRRRSPTAGEPPAALPAFTHKHQALFWFVTEYTNLMTVFETAVATGADVHACELPRFMRAFFARRCGTTHLNVLFERALEAARRLDDPLRLAEAHSDLGFARYNAGRMPEAHAAYDTAEPLVSRTGDTWVLAELTMRRAFLLWDEGNVQEPLSLFCEAATLYDSIGSLMGRAHAMANEAWALLQLGYRDAAATRARAVLDLAGTEPDWPSTLTARLTLGMAIIGEDPDEATGHLTQALDAAREDSHKHNEAWCLNCLGVALRQLGRYDEALASHRQAFALLDELFEEHWKVHFLNGYGETCRLAGLPEEALRLHRQALRLAPEVGYRYEEALAHEGIAAVLADTDPPTAARHRAAGQALLQAT